MATSLALCIGLAFAVTGCGTVHDASADAKASLHTAIASRTVVPFEGEVARVSATRAYRFLSRMYKVPIEWNTATGIQYIGYYPNQFRTVDAWRGQIHNVSFKLAAYRSYKPMYGDPPAITYMVGILSGRGVVTGMAFHSPVWWVAFTKQYVVFAAHYHTDGSVDPGPLRFYAADLLTGSIITEPSLIKRLIHTPSIPRWVEGLPLKQQEETRLPS